MPKLNGVVETALYVDDLGRARAFYESVLGLTPVVADSRLCAFDVGGRNVRLLCARGSTLETVNLPGGGTFPPHDGSGPIHVGCAVAAEDLPAWEERLAAGNVAI